MSPGKGVGEKVSVAGELGRACRVPASVSAATQDFGGSRPIDGYGIGTLCVRPLQNVVGEW